jgi:hypothetical protein
VDGAIFTLAAYADLGKELGEVKVLADGRASPSRATRASTASTSMFADGRGRHVNAFNFPAWGWPRRPPSPSWPACPC